MGIKVNVDNKTIISDANNKIALNLAPSTSHPDQGLSIDGNGKLIATRATPVEPSPTSTVNTPGNGVGSPSYTPSSALATVGLNSTVSRHQSYEGTDSFIKNNEGVIMSTITGENITGGLAYYMIYV